MTTAQTIRPAQTGRNFLNSHASKQVFSLSTAVVCGSLSTVLMLLQWLCFALAAEKLIIEKVDFDSVSHLLFIFACSLLARAALTRLQTSFAQTASLNIRRNIRSAILAHWRTSSPINIKETSVGASAAQWVEEVEAMDGYFSRYWPQQMLAVISPLLILSFVAYFNWLCALLLLISAPLIPLFMILVGMGAENLNQKYSTIRQRLAGHFLDRVANLSTVKLLNAEKEVFEEVGEHSDHYRKVVMKTLKLAFLSSTVLEFFTSVAIASLAIYIGFSLYGAITWGPADSLTLFTGLLILILAPEFFQPLRNLSQYYHDRAAALGAANNLVLILNKAPDEKNRISENNGTEKSTQATVFDEKQIHKDTPEKVVVHLNKLRIAYQEDHALSNAIELELGTGQTLVITGSSGSGKSTLLNMIAGYIPVHHGQIQLYPNPNLAIAYLPQNAWIKNDSIYKNLAALAPNSSEHDMLEVLDSLGLANELALNHTGLDTIIGEHGQGLSGGQMQRIALARVLLNPAPIVLLDEPSAKLDIISKQYIIKALQSLQSKTLLMIATHDPELIAIADVHINLDTLKEAADAVLV
jgi:ATP-binding cassette subfamily C protein CydD